MITSLQNDRVKLAHALLTQSKTRRKEGKIALEGLRLIRDAMERGGYSPEFILFDPDQVNIDAITPLTNQVYEASAEVIRHICATEQPQGIVGVFPMPTAKLPARPERVLIVDHLRDPGNLGTILRTAAGAGVDVVLVSPGSVDLYNDKALRAAVGAHFRVPAAEKSWAEIDAYVGELPVYLADMTGDAAYDAVDWTQPHALIIGSEADGASPDAEGLATSRVYIPMAADTESLNAAVAAGILLFEAARQRNRTE
ncbi:MAG: RNA methyltransferase [Anaerolinea sp.]|nr:RNA methyltransferase [Anaerolinea sp.]